MRPLIYLQTMREFTVSLGLLSLRQTTEGLSHQGKPICTTC